MMNWLRLEHRIREAIEEYEIDRKNGLDSGEATILLIDDILAEETGRGHSIKDK